MPKWTLRLLGDAAIESPKGVRPLRLGRKGTALLVYVAAHGSAGVPRGRLLSLLWDERSAEDSRNALRQCLHQVRGELDDAAAILANDGDRILLDEVSCDVDIRRFEALAKRSDQPSLGGAVAWYRGDFAETLDGSAELSQWGAAERERFRDLAHGVVARLSEHGLDAALLEDTTRLARRLLAADRAHEGTCRALMRLYVRAGLRSKALQVWSDCQRALRDDLGVRPSERSASLAATLLAHGAAPPEPDAWWPAATTPPGSALLSAHDPQVQDLMLRGWQLFTTYTAASHAEAAQVYGRVIARVPRHVDALTLLGWTHWFAAVSGWAADPDARFQEALRLADRALACGGGHAPPHGLMGKLLLWQGRHENAITHLQQAVALAPGYAYMHFHLGEVLMWCGRPDEALPHLDRALRLDPNEHGVFLTIRAMARWMAGDATQAHESLDSAIRRNPSYPWAHGMLAVVHHEAGDLDRARRAAHLARRLNRRFSVRFAERVLPFRQNCHRQRVAAAWRAAGLPDEESVGSSRRPAPGRFRAGRQVTGD